ncbi:hypothetical protein [Endozoicomonas ascidiicola]|uniref:phage nozzle protein n=1 Tax=Endozoicomonas ascidiicola TaxID=1698521 RepID=UPI000836A35C|nr:hypothetical protein [Endozoicomonas ascidiicola]
MGLISTTIPNMVNGVSQQPYALRLASQCEELVNAYPSVVEGLRKRQGSRYLGTLPDLASDPFLHVINRDSTEKYVVAIVNGDLKVFDLEGNEKTVTFPDGKAYLNAASPMSDLQCMTVADYTFVLNKTVIVRESASQSPVRPYEALVWVKQGSYGAKYILRVDGKSTTYVVPNGSDAAHADDVTTDFIAEKLRAGIKGQLGGSWYVSRQGSTLHIKRNSGASFSISTDDSVGDNGLDVLVQKTQRFSDLPARSVNGFTLEISGDQSSSFDNYYVTYNTEGTADGAGVWKESLKGGEVVGLDATTMPHVLIRNADGTFTFKVAEWADRKVGDLDSNPLPSFVDRKINDVFFHRNRLGFISDENVVFSKASEFFNFFISTATALLDDDPIDVGVSHTKVSILRHAIPFNETLLLFSDKTQFQLGVTDILTPETISINQTTEYECSLKAKPVGAGRFVYFAVNRGAYTGIREYYVDGDTESTDAQEITGHVPRYIPGGAHKIAASSNEDAIVVLTEREPNAVYLYKYYYSGAEKLQSAWSKWVFPACDRILDCEFIESQLVLLTAREGQVHIEKINLEPGAIEEDWSLHVHLDGVVSEAQVTTQFNEGDPTLEGDNTTTITLPYKHDTSSQPLQLITAPGGDRTEGVIEDTFNSTARIVGDTTEITLSGDWRNQPLYLGIPYEFRYRFSTLVIKEEAVGGGEMTVGKGRIQLRNISLLYNRTGYFRIEVTPFGRDTYTYTYSGRVVGSGHNQVGRVPIEEGDFTFPVASKNDTVTMEIVNDTYLPCFFLSAEWEAFYSIRSQRI